MMPVLFPVAASHKLKGRESVVEYDDIAYYHDQMPSTIYERCHGEYSKEERGRVVNALDVAGNPDRVHGID